MIRDRQFPSRTVAKYYLYQGTVTYGFFWPVFTLFLLSRELSYTQIGLLGSISAAVVVVGELPTGYVADRIGHRNGLILGSGFLTASLVGFLVARSFAAFAALWILWALGMAFQSGSGDAWLYEVLSARDRSGAFTRVRGRGGAVNQWVTAGSMLAAGGLYAMDPRLPFVAGGLLIGSSIPVLLTMPRAGGGTGDGDDAEGEGDESDRDHLEMLAAARLVREQLTRPPLRSFVLYVALFFGVVSAADEFIQPVAVYAIGLPESGLGPLYTGFTVVAAVASYYADRIETALSTRWAVLLVPTFVGVFLVLPALVPLAALPLFFAMKSANVVVSPIASGYVNDHVGSAGRATVLSAASMAYAAVRLPLKPAIGAVADATSPILALAALGGGLLCCTALVYLWEAPAADSVEAGGAPSK